MRALRLYNFYEYTHGLTRFVLTNIEIADELIEKALHATGLKTKRAAVEEDSAL